MTENNQDTELYLPIPGEKDERDWSEQYGGSFIEYDDVSAQTIGAQGVIVRKLFRVKNPFAAAPQVRKVCVKWAKPWPGSKICIGHKYQWRYMYTTGFLVITLKEPQDIKGDIEECLKESAIYAAIAAIIAAIASGGSGVGAAVDLFIKLFVACLNAKITGDVLSVRLDLHNEWGDWE